MQEPFKLGRVFVPGQYPYKVGDTLRCVTSRSASRFLVGKDYKVVVGKFGEGYTSVMGEDGDLYENTASTFINLSAQEASMPDVSILGDMVKTTTIPATVKQELVGATDRNGPGAVRFSVMPGVGKSIHLVVGARWKDKHCPSLTKKTLGELINRLEAIHSLMED